MKQFFFLIIILIFCASLIIAQKAPKKYALLIGISEYSRGVDEDKEWWNLNSKSDIEAIKQTLVRKFNFKPSEIKTLLTKQETTRQSILNAFKDLTAKVQAGDIVYLHYSGHGSQVLDDNGDELDGLDETIVPSDYKTRQDGSRNLRDDEIGKFLNELKAKNPANVTFVFDSCFSGTITRDGRQLVRGESYRGKIPKMKPNAVPDGSSGLLPKSSLGNNFVIISATRSDQTAKETDNDSNGKMGALTFSLVKALNEANPQTTYQDIFDRVQNLVSQRVEAQNPQIEGETNAVLLKGTANPTEPYILLSRDKRTNVILQAGSLQGMTKGSKFAIFPAGSKSRTDGKKLTDAEIIEINPTTAILKLAASVAPSLLQSARAFETERNYSETLLKVSLGENFQANEVLNELNKFSLVEITKKDDWDVLINKDKSGKIILERSDGSKLFDLENNENLARNIRTILEREIRFRTIRALANNSADLQIELRAVPVEVEKSQNGAVTKILTDKQLERNSEGKFTFSENDYLALEVRNKGNQDAWVTILDLTADGKISPMFPHPRVAMADNKIVADDKWKRLPLPFVFRITPPFGREIYKVIATVEPTDFSPLLDEQIVRGGEERVRKATQSPLGKILRSATLVQRSEIGNAEPPNWTTAEFSFEVKKK
ncbi:MAG TPA: caspase family protein [Pyrinomonadaceae bacterium]|nr:caspase family protein [Pyrinomonadaceae bacterium]